jgi:protein-ribulosamine 3-kinase
MPLDIRHLLEKLLPQLPGQDGYAGEFSCRPVGGGSINPAFQILTKPNKRWFGKFNNARQYPGLFVKESNGLALLRRLGPIRVPTVIGCMETEGAQVLLLEWIDEGPRTDDFWRRFGQQLALQHQVIPPESPVLPSPSAPPQPTPEMSPPAPGVIPLASTPPAPRIPQPAFGLDENNYMGALVQDNTPSPTWIEFFRDRRLEPQVRSAIDAGLIDKSTLGHFQRLYTRLPDFFPPEPPSLLHGDLWSGNFLCDTASQPVLIDPAVYFGHRHMDLAMTTLFGGFEPAFYEAYNDIYPFPKNYRQQWEIANLYPLLIHLNLFGPSSGHRPSPLLGRDLRVRSVPYKGNILHTIQRF